MLCLIVADIHGNISQYEKIKTIVKKEQVSHVFFAGDLLPKDGGSWSPSNSVRTPSVQKEFIENYLRHFLEDLSKYCNIYAIFGNDDFRSNLPLVKNINPRVHFLDNEVVKLEGVGDELFVAGYPYVSLTPFLLKDWEKWDDNSRNLLHKVFIPHGYRSLSSGFVAIDYLHLSHAESTVSEDLEALTKISDPKKTIYIMHEPPFDTPLDRVAEDNRYIKRKQKHVGSKAVRSFIEKYSPMLTIHGHIHETYAESGDFLWRCHSSISITPANNYKQEKLSYVLVDLSDLSLITRYVD